MTRLPELQEPDLESPRQGSAAWYALLFTPADRRAGFAAALACRREILSTVRRRSDEGVARVRLAWWREEAGLLASARPRHPATRHLAAALTEPAAAARTLSSMLDAAERDLARRAFPDPAALHAHCADDGGAFYELVARATGAHALSEGALDALRELGAGARLVDVVRSFHQDTVDGRCYLPETMTSELDLGSEAARAAPSGPLRDALARVAADARSALGRGATALPASERNACATVLTLAALRARLLRRLERRRYAVLGQWIELTGPRKLITAWNAARRSLRGHAPRLAGIRP